MYSHTCTVSVSLFRVYIWKFCTHYVWLNIRVMYFIIILLTRPFHPFFFCSQFSRFVYVCMVDIIQNTQHGGCTCLLSASVNSNSNPYDSTLFMLSLLLLLLLFFAYLSFLSTLTFSQFYIHSLFGRRFFYVCLLVNFLSHSLPIMA